MIIDILEKKSFLKRQLWLFGEINEDLAYDFIHKINYLCMTSNKPIFIFINSEGGLMESESAIIDSIKAAQKEGIFVHIIVIGSAYSAAASILSIGTKGCRYAYPNSSIMLHPYSIELAKDYSNNQKLLMTFFDKVADKSNKMIAIACGMENNYEKFLSDINNGLWLTPEEAIKYGVIDYVWDNILPFGG